MPIEWLDDYATGIARIDQDHQRLVELINRVEDAIRNRYSSAAVAAIFEELEEYASEHFGREERLMADSGYDGLDAHIASHRLFVGQLETLEAAIVASGDEVALDGLFEFLSTWLVSHILREDKAYVPALAALAG